MARPKGNIDEQVRLLREGVKPKEVSKITGTCISNVYATAQRYGIDYKRSTHRYAENEKEQIRAYREAGHTVQQTALKFGITESMAKQISCGVGTVGNQYTLGTFDRIANAKRYINERTPGFEYAGNFTGIDGYVDLKCKTCGTVVTRSFISVRHGKGTCPICYEQEQQERKRIRTLRKAEERQQREEQRKIKAVRRQEKKQAEAKERERKRILKLHACLVCGEITARPKYCSKICARRAQDKTQEIRRRTRMRSLPMDSDITLEGLYKRDGGRCHICGMLCLPDDYEIRGGQKQCGEYYPSIDHVIPLARGGSHTWDNVKLAHRRCNTFKSDKDLDELRRTSAPSA